ncbi:hypothetical protein E4U41_002915, partial [Claviceps citrina]
MSPSPPRTRTPRRFLPPNKRPPASQTPLPQASQFQSTPRFGSSSSATPRPAARRAQGIEDVVDEDEDVDEDEGGDGCAVGADGDEWKVLEDVAVDSITSGSQRTDVSTTLDL